MIVAIVAIVGVVAMIVDVQRMKNTANNPDNSGNAIAVKNMAWQNPSVREQIVVSPYCISYNYSANISRFYVAGWVRTEQATNNDTCLGAGRIREWSCRDADPIDYNLTCPYGCRSGACCWPTPLGQRPAGCS